MKKISYCILLICIFCNPNVTIGQTTPEGYNAENNLRLTGDTKYQFGVVQTFNNSYKGVQGSPYLFDEWHKGEILLKDGSYLKNIDIKYNSYDDDIYYLLKPENQTLVAYKDKIKLFIIESNQKDVFYVFKNLTTDSTKKDNYKFYQILSDGKTTLMVRRIKKFIKSDHDLPYGSSNPYDEFYAEDKYYLLKPDNSIVSIKQKNKAILKELSDKETEIKKIIESQHLDVSKEEDLIKVVNLYNQL